MEYKNIDIRVHDRISVTITHKEFMFAYNNPDAMCKIEYVGQYSNFGGLQCNFEHESKEYNDLYDWCLKVAKNVLNEVYGMS